MNPRLNIPPVLISYARTMSHLRIAGRLLNHRLPQLSDRSCQSRSRQAGRVDGTSETAAPAGTAVANPGKGGRATGLSVGDCKPFDCCGGDRSGRRQGSQVGGERRHEWLQCGVLGAPRWRGCPDALGPFQTERMTGEMKLHRRHSRPIPCPRRGAGFHEQPFDACGNAGIPAGALVGYDRAGWDAGVPRFMGSSLGLAALLTGHEPENAPQRNEGTQSFLLCAPSFLCGSNRRFRGRAGVRGEAVHPAPAAPAGPVRRRHGTPPLFPRGMPPFHGAASSLRGTIPPSRRLTPPCRGTFRPDPGTSSMFLGTFSLFPQNRGFSRSKPRLTAFSVKVYAHFQPLTPTHSHA